MTVFYDGRKVIASNRRQQCGHPTSIVPIKCTVALEPILLSTRRIVNLPPHCLQLGSRIGTVPGSLETSLLKGMHAVGRLAVRGQRLRNRLIRAVGKAGFRDEYFLILVSILIGATTGIFAHIFFSLIEHFREFAFGEDNRGGLYAAGPWMLVLLPAAGALAVGFLTHYLAREAKGHGVPEVMDAIHRKGGEIRPRVAGAKAVASALTIGSGGSAGMEGPIIQIGAAVGSGIGQYLHIHRRQMGVVVCCGVSAGIAAIFNAPIAGVLFALEIFLKDFSFRTFSPVVFSSVISCSIMHGLGLRDEPIFEVRALAEAGYEFPGVELPLFLLLGLICSVGAVVFIRALYACEDLADRIRIYAPLKPAIGAIALGLSGVVYLWLTGSSEMPAFFGNGYPAIESTLSRAVLEVSAGSLFLLFVLKVLATCLTLGSGGSGGVFAPSLFMGATLGAGLGILLYQLGIIEASSVNVYALVGMAALVAGTTHAPLTAIVMLYEITREPKVILPIMLAAIVATAGAQLLFRDSIYTLKLRRRGVRVGSLTDLTLLRRLLVDDVGLLPAHQVKASDPLQSLITIAGETGATDFVVVDENDEYQGMVTGSDMRIALLQPEAVSLLLVGELLRPGVPVVGWGDTLDTVLDKFASGDLESLPVASKKDESIVAGLITRGGLMNRYQQELDGQSR